MTSSWTCIPSWVLSLQAKDAFALGSDRKKGPSQVQLVNVLQFVKVSFYPVKKAFLIYLFLFS